MQKIAYFLNELKIKYCRRFFFKIAQMQFFKLNV